MACTGRPLKALEDDVRDEGVGAVPTTLQTEMMPSGEKNRALSSKKNLWPFGARLYAWYAWTVFNP